MAGAVKAAIFDLDGTLIDSAPQIAAAGNAMLKARGAAELDASLARSFIGHGADRFIARALAARDLPQDDRAKSDFMTAYEAVSAGPQALYPNVSAALERLRAAGVALGLCTNKPRGPTDAALRAAGLAGAFSVTVAGGEHGHKPAAAPLLACLSALGAAPAQAVMVGDSEADHGAALAAGTPFALQAGGYLKAAPESLGAAFMFTDFHDLAEWLLSRP